MGPPRIRAPDRPGPRAVLYSIRAPRIPSEICPATTIPACYPPCRAVPSLLTDRLLPCAAPVYIYTPARASAFIAATARLLLLSPTRKRRRRDLRVRNRIASLPSRHKKKKIRLDCLSLANCNGCCCHCYCYSGRGAFHGTGGRRPEGGGTAGRRGGSGAGGEARAGRRRQLRGPRGDRQDPAQLQVQSDDRGFGDARAGAAGAGAGPRREHDHHGLLDARDDRVRAAEAREGVVGAAGDPGGDHVVGERAHPHQPVPGGGRRGLPPQARPPRRRLPPLQPDPVTARARM